MSLNGNNHYNLRGIRPVHAMIAERERTMVVAGNSDADSSHRDPIIASFVMACFLAFNECVHSCISTFSERDEPRGGSFPTLRGRLLQMTHRGALKM